jgi:plastocyanin
MSLTRRKFLYIFGGVLSGCGLTNREPDYTVIIRPERTFEPASLSVPRGSIVAWHNQTDHVHTITTDPQKAQMPERISQPPDTSPFDSGDVFSGERWAYTFDVPGTYVYFCRYHELEEMFGAITVIA